MGARITLRGREVEIRRFYRQGSFEHGRFCGGDPSAVVFLDTTGSMWAIFSDSDHYDELVALEEAMTVNQEGA